MAPIIICCQSAITRHALHTRQTTVNSAVENMKAAGPKETTSPPPNRCVS
jgi:hypothetical protein